MSNTALDTIASSARKGASNLGAALPLERVTDFDWDAIDLPALPDLSDVVETVSDSVVVAAETGRRVGRMSMTSLSRAAREHPRWSAGVAAVLIIGALWFVKRRRADARSESVHSLAEAQAA
jgi:hypothetical protein